MSCGDGALPKNGDAPVVRGIAAAGTASGDIFGSRPAAWLLQHDEQAPDDHRADDRHDHDDAAECQDGADVDVARVVRDALVVHLLGRVVDVAAASGLHARTPS